MISVYCLVEKSTIEPLALNSQIIQISLQWIHMTVGLYNILSNMIPYGLSYLDGLSVHGFLPFKVCNGLLQVRLS